MRHFPFLGAAIPMAAMVLPMASHAAVVELAPTKLRVSAPTASGAWKTAAAWATLDRKIADFADLPEDWDGRQGVAPSIQVVDNAKLFLIESQAAGLPIPQLYVAGDGEVGFRWSRDGRTASVSFLEDGNVVAFVPGTPSPYEVDEAFHPAFLLVDSLLDRLIVFA